MDKKIPATNLPGEEKKKLFCKLPLLKKNLISSSVINSDDRKKTRKVEKRWDAEEMYKLCAKIMVEKTEQAEDVVEWVEDENKAEEEGEAETEAETDAEVVTGEEEEDELAPEDNEEDQEESEAEVTKKPQSSFNESGGYYRDDYYYSEDYHHSDNETNPYRSATDLDE
ncbi:hypothetical protein PTTG_10524 [Puccinia triticina 1-1 BBBD Race 1]|uniref:Uncharacterized protein n=2 Tax=Puccinia triticina TaxID=208348 RepID=A0A0C4FBD0_PUCT1|nr:hypothetical protein PTTG_10524 [Puccinia triticina 1-1 BBBD Race 1]